MKIKFVWVGKTRDERVRLLEADYLQRVGHYHRCEVAVARAAHDGSDGRRLEDEGREIASKVARGSYTIALHQSGAEMDSIEFARVLGMLEGGSRKEIVFIIGGHLGIDRRVLDKADRRLSLSRMTFPHELCRVLLLEQVYRACSIQSGTPYHK
ncbi:MAG: 23S rRNA (pseudouridine(1915)-N(3))-methyltransferase RlmH [Acidobacteria bacterium]|nr:23S rRNA (pseudouridine(1915)-N(3))-methyltransferase RlmH [Acidobacteriota bacterium]